MKECYFRRRLSEANKLSQQKTTAWSDSDNDRQLQMESEPTDRRPSDTDSQISGQASDSSEGHAMERPVTPAAPAAIPMEALLALKQALKLANTGSRIRQPSFHEEGDLTSFFKKV